MMQVLPKTHEQRIAELERLVAELQRVVGVPGPLGGLRNDVFSGLSKSQQDFAMTNVQAVQAIMAQNANRQAEISSYQDATQPTKVV